MNPFRILVVEDEAIVSMDIEERLTAMGYLVAGSAANGTQALELAGREPPDLVLMDVRLQGAMDGIDTAEEILRRFHLPVIFLTAYSEDATLERAKLAEPYGYLLKPFDDRELKSAIEIALHKHHAEKEIRLLNRLYDVLSQVNQTIVRVHTREELFESVCRLVVERGAFDLAWIGWLDDDTSRIHPVARFGKQDRILSEAEFTINDRPEGQANPGKALREGSPFVCNQCGSGGCFYPAAKRPAAFGFQSCGSFPLRFRGRVRGVLSLCAAEQGAFGEREIRLLEEIATDVSFALDSIEGDARRERAEAGLLRQNAVLEGINRMFMEALSPHSEEELGRICLAVAEEVTGSRFGFFGEINAEGRLGKLAMSDPGWEACRINDRPGYHKLPSDLAIRGIHGKVIIEGKGFYTNDPSSHPDRIGLPPGHPPLTSFLGAPLIREGRPVGMIGLGNREGGYSTQDLEALEAVTPAMVEAFSRKRAEAALRASEERLRLFIEYAPASLAMFDREMRYLTVSRRWLSDYHLGERDLRGRSHYEIFPEITETWKAVHRRALAGEVVQAETDRFDRADGSVQWLRWEVRPWHDQAGNVAGIVIFTEDVTERKQAEESLKRQIQLQDQFAKIAASVPGVVHSFRLRPDGTACMPFATPAVEDLFGIPRDQLAEDISPVYANIHPDDLQHVRDTVRESARLSSPWHDQYRYLHPAKGLRWIEGWSMPQAEPDGSIVWHGFVMDITERKQLEERQSRVESQLRQAQKMEALGTLAGGIAHDFNNILGIIIGFTELALIDSGAEARAAGQLREVLKAAQRARELVQQILAFSRLKEQEKKPVQVGLIVNEAMKMLRASLPATIEIKLHLASKAVVLGDPTQMHQVLMNLCTNAAHAMREKGGILEVGLFDVLLRPESILPHSDLKPGPYMKLTVGDSGHGIHATILNRIFDPFFTTKEQGVGTGLGLSVVHGIVNSHGGSIEVESHLGKGTTFQVLLPAMERAQAVETAEPAPLPLGRERILLVDDEPALAAAIKHMLQHLGYEVDSRTSSTEALDVFRKASGKKSFDLVITDMTMPKLTGEDLAVEILRLRPGLPILLCTGFSEKLSVAKAEELGIRAVLMKPVDVRRLAETVRRLLDGKTAGQKG